MLHVVISPHVFRSWELIYAPTCYLCTIYITNNFLPLFNLIFGPRSGAFFDIGTFTSSHKVGHFPIPEQGQIQIPTLAQGWGGGSGFTLTHALLQVLIESSQVSG